jgi:DNA-binding IclR family transcriptional regulator
MKQIPASVFEQHLGILDAGPMKLLRTLLSHGGKEMGRTQLSELAGYEASGGSFARYMSTLRSLGLIEYPKKTTARPAEWLLRKAGGV